MTGSEWLEAALAALLRMVAERGGQLVAVRLQLPGELLHSGGVALSEALAQRGHADVSVESVHGPSPRLLSAEFER